MSGLPGFDAWLAHNPLDDELGPDPDEVDEKYEAWLAKLEAADCIDDLIENERTHTNESDHER